MESQRVPKRIAAKINDILNTEVSPAAFLKNFLGLTEKTPPIFIKNIETQNNLNIVRLTGDIDMSTVPGIEKMIIASRKNRGALEGNILLDFKCVGNVDSATIAALLILLSDIKHKNHRLGLVNISPRLEKMFAILEVKDLFKIYKAETTARKELSS